MKGQSVILTKFRLKTQVLSVKLVGHSLAIFYSMLLLKNQTVILAYYIKISEEQWKNDEISFQMCVGTESL